MTMTRFFSSGASHAHRPVRVARVDGSRGVRSVRLRIDQRQGTGNLDPDRRIRRQGDRRPVAADRTRVAGRRRQQQPAAPPGGQVGTGGPGLIAGIAHQVPAQAGRQLGEGRLSRRLVAGLCGGGGEFLLHLFGGLCLDQLPDGRTGCRGDRTAVGGPTVHQCQIALRGPRRRRDDLDATCHGRPQHGTTRGRGAPGQVATDDVQDMLSFRQRLRQPGDGEAVRGQAPGRGPSVQQDAESRRLRPGTGAARGQVGRRVGIVPAVRQELPVDDRRCAGISHDDGVDGRAGPAGRAAGEVVEQAQEVGHGLQFLAGRQA